MFDIFFLDLADVLEIHSNHIALYGGLSGIHDLGLLLSALAMPKATFSGQYLHKNLYEMAAAYAFHLCQNHPFADGNKRTAVATALVFLELNGISIVDPEEKLYQVMMDVEAGKTDKNGLANTLSSLPKGNPFGFPPVTLST